MKKGSLVVPMIILLLLSLAVGHGLNFSVIESCLKEAIVYTTVQDGKYVAVVTDGTESQVLPLRVLEDETLVGKVFPNSDGTEVVYSVVKGEFLTLRVFSKEFGMNGRDYLQYPLQTVLEVRWVDVRSFYILSNTATGAQESEPSLNKVEIGGEIQKIELPFEYVSTEFDANPKWLAFSAVMNNGDRQQIWVLNTETEELVEVKLPDEGQAISSVYPRISPDGTAVAFIIDTGSLDTDMGFFSLITERSYTRTIGDFGWFDWAPDGLRIAYSGQGTTLRVLKIYHLASNTILETDIAISGQLDWEGKAILLGGNGGSFFAYYPGETSVKLCQVGTGISYTWHEK